MVFVSTTGVITKAGAGFKTAADLKGKKVAVIAGTTNEQAVKEQIREGRLANVTLVTVQNRAEGVGALQSGKADGYASDKLLLVGAEFRNAAAFTLLTDDLSFEPYGIALPQGDWAFRTAVNRGLAHTYRSGLAVQVFRKWFEQVGLSPSGVMMAVFQFGALPE